MNRASPAIVKSRYDVIVVGAGHNGLTVANYLRRSGLSVIVLEKERGVGGNAVTSEPLLAGYRHNPHANYLTFCDIMPMMGDLSLQECGLDVIYPDAQFGLAFSDGRPPVVLHRQDLLDRTSASLGAYSKKDARTYAELKRRSAKLGATIRRGLFSVPTAEWFAEQRSAVQLAYGGMCSTNSIGRRSAREVIDELFRAAEVRMLMYQLAIDSGISVEEPGGDLAFLGIAIWTAGRWRLPLGGMQRMSDALHRAAEEAGVDVLCGCPVRRVLVDKGVAVGIVNEDDSMILATKAIVGAIPIPALLGELVEAHSLSSQEQADLRNFVSQEGGSIATSMFCLNDQPCYKSARYDAQINRCFKTTVGYESPADILNSAAENRTGLLPRPAGTIRVNTLWDESQAPPGMHVAGIDSPFPAVSSMGADMWRQVEESFAQAFYDVWSRHTDNLHAGSSAGMLCDLGARFERRMLLRLGSTQYRTSIEKLYMCGPGTYPGGGVHGANAYNAARVVMSDLGIESRLDKR